MTAIASHYVDTSPTEEPSGVHDQPRARAKTLDRLGPPNRFMTPRLERLLVDVADAFQVLPEALRGRDRHRAPAFARATFWWLARELYGFSFPELGRLLGTEHAFDHTTVMAGVTKVRHQIARESRVGLIARGLLVDRPDVVVVTVPGEGRMLEERKQGSTV